MVNVRSIDYKIWRKKPLLETLQMWLNRTLSKVCVIALQVNTHGHAYGDQTIKEKTNIMEP